MALVECMDIRSDSAHDGGVGNVPLGPGVTASGGRASTADRPVGYRPHPGGRGGLAVMDDDYVVEWQIGDDATIAQAVRGATDARRATSDGR